MSTETSRVIAWFQIPAHDFERATRFYEAALDVSLQRAVSGGVPMSLFVHKNTEELHPRTLELMEEVAKRVEQQGIQAWWDLDPAELLGAEAAETTGILARAPRVVALERLAGAEC